MNYMYLPVCVVCGQPKKPLGRDPGLMGSHCDVGCDGYSKDPLPSRYWSREEEPQEYLTEAVRLLAEIRIWLFDNALLDSIHLRKQILGARDKWTNAISAGS